MLPWTPEFGVFSKLVSPEGDRSQVNFDFAGRCRAADQQVARGRSLQWIRRVLDSSSDQGAFAGMANPRTTLPLYGDIAGLGEFKQAGIP